MKTFKSYLLSESRQYDERVKKVREKLDRESGVTKSNIKSVIEKIATSMGVLEMGLSAAAKNDFINDVKRGYKFERKDKDGFTPSLKKKLSNDLKKVRNPRDISSIVREAEDNDVMMDVYSDEYEETVLNKLAKELKYKSYVDYLADKFKMEYMSSIGNTFPEGEPLDVFSSKIGPWISMTDIRVIDVADAIAKNDRMGSHYKLMKAMWQDQYNDTKSDLETLKKAHQRAMAGGDKDIKGLENNMKRVENILNMLKANKW